MLRTISDADREAWTIELEHLRQEHRDLDAAIEALTHLGMTFLDDQLTPDIIA